MIKELTKKDLSILEKLVRCYCSTFVKDSEKYKLCYQAADRLKLGQNLSCQDIIISTESALREGLAKYRKKKDSMVYRELHKSYYKIAIHLLEEMKTREDEMEGVSALINEFFEIEKKGG